MISPGSLNWKKRQKNWVKIKNSMKVVLSILVFNESEYLTIAKSSKALYANHLMII